MKNKKLLLIIVPTAIVFMAGIVFLALWLSRGKPDYAGAANYVGEILKSEGVVTEYVNSNSGFTYDEIDRDSLGSFENAVSSISSYYESLRASNALNDEEVLNRYEQITPLINKLTEISDAQNLLVNYVDKVKTSGYASADTELDAILSSPNGFIVTLGSDLTNYYASLSEFEEKYKAGKADNYDKMIEEYGNFVLSGEKLAAKYSNVAFEDVFQVSPAVIIDYYAQVKDLESYLKAQL